MGGNVYSCFSGTCVRDSSHEFSEVLSISNEEDYQGNAANSHEGHAHRSLSSPHPIASLKSRNVEESKCSAGDQPPSTATEVVTKHLKVPSEDAYDNADSGRESPDNRSQESVMTAISPTKDRRSPLKSPKRPTAVEAIKNNKTGKVEKLYLHGSENEVLGDWLELHDLIREGNCVALATYAKQHRIDLQTVRFTDHRYTPLHLAVLYDHLEMVQYLIKEGVNVNVKDESGYTAMGIAYEQSSLQVINELFNAKAAEFADSPYSPYALSVISNALSVQSSTKAPLHANTHNDVHRSNTAADFQKRNSSVEYNDNVSDLDNGSVRSEPLMSAWSTPRSRTHSLDVPYTPHIYESMPSDQAERPRRLTVNSPSSLDFRNSPVVVDSVKRRMAQLTESLDKLAQRDRQRSFSLPANSPVFASLYEDRVYSPTARASLPMSAVFTTESAVPPLYPQQAHSVASDQTSNADTSYTPRSATTGDGSSVSELSGSADHTAQQKKKSMGKRLRQATGRALSMFNPVKGMPPRAPVLPGKGASSANTSGGTITTSTGLPTNGESEGTGVSGVPRSRPSLPVHTTATPVPRSAAMGISELANDNVAVSLKPAGDASDLVLLPTIENLSAAATTTDTLHTTVPKTDDDDSNVSYLQKQLHQRDEQSGSTDSLDPIGAFLLSAPDQRKRSQSTPVRSNSTARAGLTGQSQAEHSLALVRAEQVDLVGPQETLVFPTDLQSPVKSSVSR
eukprot:gene11607-13489_t